LLELAADAYLVGGWTRDDPLELDRIDQRFLADWPVRGNVARQKRRHGVHAAILIAAGAQPEDTGWWRVDDLWLHSLHCVIILVRASAEHRGISVAEVCDALRPRR
jgi:hypothetical protein